MCVTSLRSLFCDEDSTCLTRFRFRLQSSEILVGLRDGSFPWAGLVVSVVCLTPHPQSIRYNLMSIGAPLLRLDSCWILEEIDSTITSTARYHRVCKSSVWLSSCLQAFAVATAGSPVLGVVAHFLIAVSSRSFARLGAIVFHIW